MKQLIAIAGLFITLNISAQQKGIEFLTDTVFENVLARAKAEKKLIFMDCYAVWCGPCKYMDASIFPDEKLGEFHNANFINVKYDMEKPYSSVIREKYNIKAFPSFLYLDATGEVVHRAVGSSQTAAEFLEISKLATDEGANFRAINELIKKGDRSATTISSYLDMYYGAPEAESLLNQYFTMSTDEEKMSAESWSLIQKHVTNIKSEAFTFFTKQKAEYEKLFGDEDVDNYLIQLMAYTYRRAPDDFEKLKQLDKEVADKFEIMLKEREAARQKK